MELNGSMKSYERYMFEDIYPPKFVNEGAQITTYLKTGIYTKKICEVIPELRIFLGKMYDELDIIDFVYSKTLEDKFNKFMENVDKESDIDIKELIANTGEFPIVPGSSDIYHISDTSKINDEILKPNSNEDLLKSFEGISRIRNIVQINYKIYIKVFDSEKMENIDPRKIILLDASSITNKVSGEVVKKAPRSKRYRSFVTKADMNTSVCKDEKNVQGNYDSTLRNYGFVVSGAILRTDNIYTFKIGDREYRLLAEFKYNTNMKSDVQFASLMAQCLAYIKLIEKSGTPIPEVILAGDRDECCVFTYESVAEYLNTPEVNWSATPSKFLEVNNNLFMKIVNSTLKPFVFDIDEDFDFKIVVTKIRDLAKSSVTKTKINPKNISTAFHYFNTRVLHKDTTVS